MRGNFARKNQDKKQTSCGGSGCEMAIPEPKIIYNTGTVGFGALKKGGTCFFFRVGGENDFDMQ